MADNVSWTAGSGTTVATDDVAGVHYQRVKLVDGTLDGTGAIGGDATNGLDVDVTRSIPGTGATNLGKAEDAGHTDGDTGVYVLAVRRSEANALTPTAGADNDYTSFQTDTRGALVVVNRNNNVRVRVASGGLTTVTTTYTVGDQAGTIFTIAGAAKISGGGGVIQSIVLLDKGDVGTDYRIHFYRASVTLAADNAAFAVSDSDQENYCGVVQMPSMLDVGANRVSTLGNVGLGYDCSGGTSLYAAIETRTANAVYAAATDLNLIVYLALD